MTQSSRFWDRIAARYARTPVADEAAYQQKLDVTRSFFAPDSEVLEFGCGTGSTALAHAPFVKHILATDISAKMLEIAQQRKAAAGITNVTFQRASIEELDAPDAGYDAVLGLSILHLVEDRDATIRKVHGLLRPGGIFVSSTACLGDFMKILKLIAPVGRFLRLIPTVRIFTERELEASLTAAGFRLEHTWSPGRNKAVFIVARKAGAA